MLYLALIFVIIILIIENIINRKNRESENKEEEKNINYKDLYIKKDYIMTEQEYKFYRLLKNYTSKNNLNLFAQVSLYAIVNSKNYSDFNKIKSKSIDFVITDVNCKIKLCIELDDYTHIKENRQKRDNFIDKLFEELEIKMLRIPVQNYYNMTDIERKITESLL